MRTGSEPLEARSLLKTRRALALWGLIWSAAGVGIFLVAGLPGWAAGCAVVTVLAATDLAIVCRHIRQGPHYQPGKDIPPYEPDDGRNVRPGGGRGGGVGRDGDRGLG
ncbi:hypothetical protein C3486_31345 [Streptomyces sp. Ru73]|uniref:DUF6343 family protein n=1 Tax=Streptomyces sp. Ru73 TaxID=2080748 RepID=UPI000CDD04C4|nr:DUF6343 family protein [Streptomyces sp. Ru73]POX36851.1 hypothetical protein C3486_31345 [Streptomyces sp. Ru73]